MRAHVYAKEEWVNEKLWQKVVVVIIIFLIIKILLLLLITIKIIIKYVIIYSPSYLFWGKRKWKKKIIISWYHTNIMLCLLLCCYAMLCFIYIYILFSKQYKYFLKQKTSVRATIFSILAYNATNYFCIGYTAGFLFPWFTKWSMTTSAVCGSSAKSSTKGSSPKSFNSVIIYSPPHLLTLNDINNE